MANLYGIIFVTFYLGSCATTSEKSQQAPIKSVKAPKTQAVKAKPPLAKPINKAPPAPEPIDYPNFVGRLSIPENEYTEKDRQTLLIIPSSPRGGSIHEAALTIGIIRDVLTPVGADPIPPPGTNTSPTNVITTTPEEINTRRILENRAREKGLDIITALSLNPYLKTSGVYQMSWDASQLNGNSLTFVQNLTVILKAEIKLWLDFAKRLGVEPEKSVNPVVTADGAKQETPTTPTTSQPPSSTLPPAPDTSLARPAPVDPAVAAAAINKANELAQRENYAKAVAELMKLPKDSEAYLSNQENIKNWSNKGVQDLRRNAANLYRSASSTNDTASKKSYLSKAKKHLEDALNDFPEAQTLDTVRENLDIISKELERLN